MMLGMAGSGGALAAPRRVVLAVAIGSFSLAALMGIIALLGGGAFGETEVQVLLTTVTAGCAAIALLCNLAVLDDPWRWVGTVGGFAASLPTAVALVLIWHDWNGASDALFRTFFLGLAVALLFAQASLLLSAAGHRGGWILDGTLLVSSLLALIVIAQILAGDSNEIALRATGVLAILDVLGVVVTVGVARFGGRQPARPSGALTLPPDLRAVLDDRASATGRRSADLLADAVRSYLGE